jgi:murein peptide amidase A
MFTQLSLSQSGGSAALRHPTPGRSRVFREDSNGRSFWSALPEGSADTALDQRRFCARAFTEIDMRLLPIPDPEFAGASERSSAKLAAAFELASRASDFLVSSPIALRSEAPDSAFSLVRYVFEGPHGGGDPLRIGFFAGIHGDEQAGSYALLELARILVRNPALAEGYHLSLYPICNPGGFDARTRSSASGKDLNREFWKSSSEPEVRLLEREILEHAFHGLVSFHADDTSDGIYGFVRGAVLARSLLEPALASAEKVLDRNAQHIIDGFPAENGIISQCYEGILTSPPKLENTPFEIILETPHHAPEPKQIDAFVRASLAILAEYRKFIAFAADL